MNRKYPRLAEEVEKKVQAVANPATVDALENSKANKEATDKAKEEADKKVKDFVKAEEKLADADRPKEKDIVKEVKKETGLSEGLTLNEESNNIGKVLSKDYYKALRELQRDAYEASKGKRGSVDVVELNWDGPVQLGVNWSAIGGVGPEIALEFADRVKSLAEKTRDFKYDGYVVDYSDYDVDAKTQESLSEGLEENTFSQIYRNIIKIPNIEDHNALHTSFAPDDQSATISIDIFDDLDLSLLYDTLEPFRELEDVNVIEDADKIKIEIDTPTDPDVVDVTRDLFDEIYSQLTRSGRLIPNAGAKGWKVDIGAGYNARHQVSTENGDKLGITVRVPVDASSFDTEDGEDTSFLDTLEPAREIARKYEDLGVTFEERGEIQSTFPYRVDQLLTIWIPKNVKAPERDERMSAGQRGIKKKKHVVSEKKLNESGIDVLYELIDRAKSNIDDGNTLEDAVQAAIDDGLIYTPDIVDLAVKYGVIDEGQLISDMYDDLYSDMFKEVEEYAKEKESDGIDESVRTKEGYQGLLK